MVAGTTELGKCGGTDFSISIVLCRVHTVLIRGCRAYFHLGGLGDSEYLRRNRWAV
jgi:hypothetical protein